MEEININRIITKYFTGTIDDKESRLLQEWQNESSTNEDILGSMRHVWAERSTEPELVNTEALIDKIWHEGVEKSGQRRKKYTDWEYIYKVAAVILIFIVTPLLEYKVLRHNPQAESQYDFAKVIKENPAGQKVRINLPDGSIAWLNGASKVGYEAHFDDSIRLVELKGEAFFEVMKDASRPFVVHSGHLWTTALGTSFNINAYPDENTVRISLVSGKVKVENDIGRKKDVTLNPGHEVVYHEEGSNDFEERKFDADEVTGWKEGKLIFKGADYQEVLDRLKIWYGVNITTIGEPPAHFQLTTTYDNETLINILKNIRFGKEFNYELKENELILKFE